MGKPQEGLTWVFQQKVEQLELMVKEKTHNLRRLEAQRNELNTQGAGPRNEVPWVGSLLGAGLSSPLRPASRSYLQCGNYGKSYSCCRSPARTWGR
jgi:hypothetical protein